MGSKTVPDVEILITLPTSVLKMADITVNMRAYCKLLLHAAKYPHCSVNGVLLAEEVKSKDGRSLRFVDCIPLFHVTLGLSPMLETALLQIEMYCKSAGYVIAGYYQANEHFSDNQMGSIAKVIGKKVQENYQDSCLFLVDNARVSPECVTEAYRVYHWRESNWKELTGRDTVEDETMSIASTLLSSGAYRQVVDFDNHLDDITKDWRNLELNDLMDKYT